MVNLAIVNYMLFSRIVFESIDNLILFINQKVSIIYC